ncbi:hypothetical protein ACTMS0_09085 [Micromonospora sp. H33]|uniref:hypothetical protein n=1 Tax=Micromonospora sp. H33 TaxID=3452215 RepID=UPI003F88D9E5
MVAEWIVSLAASGAGALLGAAATDAWQTARIGIVALFRRSGDRRGELAAAQLDTDARTVEQADAADRDHVRQRLLPAWQTRLTDLLAEHADAPDGEAARELRALTEKVTAVLPPAQQTWVRAVNTGAVHQIGDGYANTGVHIGDLHPGR